MVVIDTSCIKLSTKRLVAGFLAAGAAMQIPAVNAFVTPLLASHPKITPLVTALAGIYALLHDPKVCDALGIAGVDHPGPKD